MPAAPSPYRHTRPATIIQPGRNYCGDVGDMPDPNAVPLFHCKSCFALYQIVKAPAGPETVDREIACRVCNKPLVAREGQFVLKYFFLREASRMDERRARQGFVRRPADRA